MTKSDGELDQIDADGEPPEFDLTPRTSAGASRKTTSTRSKWVAAGVLVVLVACAGFLVSKALGGATDYFYRVDQAVANRPQLGTKRFRIQGTVVDNPSGGLTKANKQRITFSLLAAGITAPIVYTGSDPPALFKKCEPVLIVGHWASSASDAPFLGDQIIIKHSENYTAEHESRVSVDKACT